jgi:hypothetical protein
MKIYIAAPETHCLKITNSILLSYYDLKIGPIPFRKKTWASLQEPIPFSTVQEEVSTVQEDL